jgi:hypothetical protein
VYVKVGHKIKAITRLLKKAGIRTVFTTKYTLGNLLRWQQGRDDKYDSNGVYQLKCTDCDKKYVGQTGRSFKTRFNEHRRDFDACGTKSLYAKHLLEHKHAMHSMENCMTILEHRQKGRNSTPWNNTIFTD